MTQNWRVQARCRGMNSEEFFPVNEALETATVYRAKAVCHACPVLPQCRAEALEVRDVFGVRGGMTGPEREAQLRQ